MSAIKDFYLGGHDNRGRTLENILQWDDIELERVHDWIQWIFPTPERSKFNASAPTLDTEDTDLFKNNTGVREIMGRAVIRFEQFLCLEANKPWWVSAGNHNHLRITRVIRSLQYLGFPTAAHHLFCSAMVMATTYPQDITVDTIEFWIEALTPDYVKSNRQQ